MKRFNLEEYLKNPSRKVVTRDGRDVRIICTDKKGSDWPIIGLGLVDEEYEEPFFYQTNGRSYRDETSDADLFFAPNKQEGWINIFSSPAPEVRTDGSVYGSYEEAKSFVKNNPDVKYYVATIKIKWEE